MLRTIYWYIYFFSYLVYSLPTLKRVKELPANLDIERRDREIHDLPKKWGRNLVNLTGSIIKVSGKENIPDGPVLFVSNHQGNFDIPILMGFIEKPFGFISKEEVKNIPLVPLWMKEMKCIFINRRNRRQAVQAIKEGTRVLQEGHSLVIFPEGTRSKGRAVGQFKHGGIRMAIDAKVPIIPITINGSYKIMEQNSFRFTSAQVMVHIFRPITGHLEKKVDGKELTDLVRKTIVEALEKEEKAC